MQHDFSLFFETDNEYWQKVLDIFAKNEKYEKKIVSNRNLHHKFPRSFSKKLGEQVDNDKDNLISLSLADHFLVHYYYYLLAKKGFKQAMATAFTFMAKKGLKYMTPETAEAMAEDYAAARKIANQTVSERMKLHTGWTHTEEAKQKMKESAKLSYTEERHKADSESKKGKPHPHKGGFQSEDKRRKIAESKTGPKSEIAKKFKEHYGYFDSRSNEYYLERYYYKRYGKCSWEMDVANPELDN